MTRTNKYNAVSTDTTWNVALYIRLSREDDDEKSESNSITTQRDLLTQFIEENPEFQVYDTYIDDGFSGTDFNRPSFQRMLIDMKNNKINCIIVKDLSRFGRNYIEVGNYIEQIFPLFNIRFISLNDTLDSYKNPNQMNNIIVPFKNLINDEYARDISQKIRSALDTKKKKGEFIGSFATYGYIRDPENKGKIIVDEVAAEVVRDIFKWYLEGLGKITIAKKLNELGIPNPTGRKKELGLNYVNSQMKGNDFSWSFSTVNGILKNAVYVGDLVQSRYKVMSHKIHKAVRLPEEQWIVTENNHEPIIDVETFEKVQELLQRNTRTPSSQAEVYMLAGFIKCIDCERAMNKKHISSGSKQYFYYVCNTYKKRGKAVCTKHTIRTDVLEKAILEAIQMQINLAVKFDDLVQTISKSAYKNLENHNLEMQLNKQYDEQERVFRLKQSAYEDWKAGDLSKEEYFEFKKRYDKQSEDIAQYIEHLQEEKERYRKAITFENAWITTFKNKKNITELNREIIIQLIDMIYVHEGGNITIKFKYADEYERIANYIEENEKAIQNSKFVVNM